MSKTSFYLSLLIFQFFGKSFFAQNNALSFDGSNDDITINYSPVLDFSINDKFTIEAWYKTTAGVSIIVSDHVDIAPFVGYEVAIVSGKVVLELINNNVSNALRVETATSTFADGNWHHIACVYMGATNPSACAIYVDGTLQTINATSNNLSASITTSNSVHVGARNSTTYFSTVFIDEVRIWTRVLCAAEIQARKNCQLTGNEYGLEAYYNFNQGVSSANNSTVTNLIDLTANNHLGTLNNFALTGSTSNWVTTGATVNGTCTPFGSLAISGTTFMCTGTFANIGSSGASTYTWLPGNLNTNSITVSPTVTTTYTLNATSSASCIETALFTVSVSTCAGLKELSQLSENFLLYPNPINEKLFIKGVENSVPIQVYDILGNLIHNGVISEKAPLNLGDLKGGIYTIELNNSEEKIRRKIIKE